MSPADPARIERLKSRLKQRRVTLTEIVARIGSSAVIYTHELAAAINEVERAAVDLALAEQEAGVPLSDPNDRG